MPSTYIIEMFSEGVSDEGVHLGSPLAPTLLQASDTLTHPEHRTECVTAPQVTNMSYLTGNTVAKASTPSLA